MDFLAILVHFDRKEHQSSAVKSLVKKDLNPTFLRPAFRGFKSRETGTLMHLMEAQSSGLICSACVESFE